MKPSDSPASNRNAPVILADGKHLQLLRRGTWEYAHRPNINGIVGMVAVTAADELLLVEQYRPPVDALVIELPAGLAGDHGDELLAAAARRELLEETGYEATAMAPLSAGPVSAGLCDEIITLFLATGLKRIGLPDGDGDERITLHHVPLATVDQWLAEQVSNGKQVDLKVFSGLWLRRRVITPK